MDATPLTEYAFRLEAALFFTDLPYRSLAFGDTRYFLHSSALISKNCFEGCRVKTKKLMSC